MNPLAKQFFQENPSAKYFYVSHQIRFANPKLRPWLDDPLEPWPDYHEVLNDRAGQGQNL
jgi:hypothetical protein